MKRLIHTCIVLVIFNILPLLGNTSLILHPKNLLIALANVLVWLTQPTFSLEETQKNQSKDKNSIFLIIAMLFPSLIIPIVIWAYGNLNTPNNDYSMYGIGLFFMSAGILLRVWSIYILGRNFTAAVMFNDKHQLITDGPYKFLRHPSYSGAFLAIIGCSLLLETYLGFIIAFGCMFIAYYYRITAEEKALIAYFGEEYKALQKKTYRMIPFIW